MSNVSTAFEPSFYLPLHFFPDFEVFVFSDVVLLGTNSCFLRKHFLATSETMKTCFSSSTSLTNFLPLIKVASGT